jgi:ribosomal protein S18 acetylase RimI-like enzyme
VSVRPAEPSDAARVTELLAALGRPAVADDAGAQHAVFAQHVADGTCAIFVAEEAGATVGVVSLWFRARLNWTTPEAWVPDLYVDPAFRRRGHARALLDACVDLARRRGCHRLVLESGHQRAEAHRLYEAYGFTHAGRSYGLPLA